MADNQPQRPNEPVRPSEEEGNGEGTRPATPQPNGEYF